jgi:hypothetical protein
MSPYSHSEPDSVQFLALFVVIALDSVFLICYFLLYRGLTEFKKPYLILLIQGYCQKDEILLPGGMALELGQFYAVANTELISIKSSAKVSVDDVSSEKCTNP